MMCVIFDDMRRLNIEKWETKMIKTYKCCGWKKDTTESDMIWYENIVFYGIIYGQHGHVNLTLFSIYWN